MSDMRVDKSDELAGMGRVVNRIADTLAGERPGSGTQQALEKGLHFLAKKVNEEGFELGCAIEHETDEDVITEASQVIYWVLVGAMARGVSVHEIVERL